MKPINVLRVLLFLVLVIGFISCNNKEKSNSSSTNALEKFGVRVEQGNPTATNTPVPYDNATQRQSNKEENLKRNRIPQDGDAEFLDSIFFAIYDANADKGPKKVALLLQTAIMNSNKKQDMHWSLNNFAHKSNTAVVESAIAYVRYRHRANLPENREFAANEFGDADKAWQAFCDKMDEKFDAMKGSTLQDSRPNVYYWDWYFAKHVLSKSKYWLQPERMPKEWIPATSQTSRQ